MASSDVSMERFAHDVCVLVLEKFGIIKEPDDTRDQNKYVRHDFLTRISRSVVSFAIWIRTYFKNVSDGRCKTDELGVNEAKWIFDDYFLESGEFSGLHWGEKVCVSLALCVEYVQFARTKDFRIFLDKIAIRWGEFFEEHLRSHFEENDGFLGLYNYLEMSQMDQLDKFQEAFISEYCHPYGSIECTMELARACKDKLGLNISLEKTIFGIKTLGDIHEGFLVEIAQVKLRNFDQREEPEPEETSSGTIDSEEDSFSSTDSGVEASQIEDSDEEAPQIVEREVEAPQIVESDSSDSEIPPNDLLGIRPHEELLREIDPFFAANIPAPPKARTPPKLPESKSGYNEDLRSTSKSPERKSGTNDAPRSSSKSPESQNSSIEVTKSSSKLPKCELGPIDDAFFSKLIERELGQSDATKSSSKLSERDTGPSDAPKSFSKSPERDSGPSDAPKFSKSPEREYGVSDAPKYFSGSLERDYRPIDVHKSSKSPERDSVPSDAPKSFSKSPERDSGPSNAPKSSRSPERESRPSYASKSSEIISVPCDAQPRPTSKSLEREADQCEVLRPASKSPELESVPTDAQAQSSPETEDQLKERVYQIFTRLEHDIVELRALLHDHGLLEIKSGRRGSTRLRVQDSKDKLPPGPEGLI